MDSVALMFRNIVEITYKVHGGKDKIEKLWPLFVDKGKDEHFVMTKEMYEEIKKAHKLN